MVRIIKTDYLIIGGGIAGTTAAETIRSQDSHAKITVIENEPHPLYSRVLLPEFIRGEVDEEGVMMRSLKDYEDKKISLYLSEGVARIDTENKKAETDKGKVFSYKKLLVSSGGHPRKTSLFSRPDIFRLHTLDDAQRIKKFLSERAEGEAVVVGGGFMALEFIEVLKHYVGWKTKLLVLDKMFWGKFMDENGFSLLKSLWDKNGIDVFCGEEVSDIAGNGDRKKVLTKKGNMFFTDFVGVGIGFKRNLEFLPHLGVKPPNGALEVNEYLESELTDVWGAGDVVLYKDIIFGGKTPCRNWSSAFIQGRIAGSNMYASSPLGQDGSVRNHEEYEKFSTIPVYSISHLGYTLSMVGNAYSETANNVSFAVRMEAEKKSYINFFTDGRVLTGAFMINSGEYLGLIIKAVRGRKEISGLSGLSDAKTNLDELLT